MTDERFVYNADLRDRKRAAQGARAKKGGSRSKSCTLPSDALSAAQKRKLNGSVESISLNSPMSWARLRDLTPELQFLYLDHLVNEHKARRVDLCAMLGVATCTFWKLQHRWVSRHPPSAAHGLTEARYGAGGSLGGVHARRAGRKRHGALYGLTRARRAASADRRSRARVYFHGQL